MFISVAVIVPMNVPDHADHEEPSERVYVFPSLTRVWVINPSIKENRI